MNRKLADDARQLAAARRPGIVHTPAEPEFEHILRLVQLALGMPMTAVRLATDKRQRSGSVGAVDSRDLAGLGGLFAEELRRHETVMVPDALADQRLADHPLVAGGAGIRSFVAAPLVLSNGSVAGALYAADTSPRMLDETTSGLLAGLAACCVNEVELRQRAALDDLTGFLNRHAFVDELKAIHDAFTRAGRPGVLAILDLDHFKSVNDRFGHAGGDRVLQGVATACREVLGGRAALGRIGGEEFGIAFADTECEEAIAVLERLRAALAALTFPDLPELFVTGSFGVASLHAEIANVSAWFKMADAALYGAKQAGRNRVISFSTATGLPATARLPVPVMGKPDNDGPGRPSARSRRANG